MGNQFLGLSLFVMLLSFFIILNAVSSFEETKSKPVLNSISMTFANKELENEIIPGKVVAETAEMQEGSTLDKLEGLFKAQIAGVKTKQNRLGTIMYATLPFDEFQLAIQKSLTVQDAKTASPVSNYDFMPLLVSLLETQRNVTYMMEMTVMTPQEPLKIATQSPVEFKKLNKSVSGIAQKLEEAGLARYQITAGLKRGETGMVELIFRRYEPFNPLGEADPQKVEGG